MLAVSNISLGKLGSSWPPASQFAVSPFMPQTSLPPKLPLTNSCVAALFAIAAFVSQFTSLASSLHNKKMIPPPPVSVVMDSYNHGDFFEEAIDSVLSHDHPSDQFELLVVNDGSTGDTAERVREYGTCAVYCNKTK